MTLVENKAKGDTVGTGAEARRLYLGQVDGRFDPARDLALGPFCFHTHESRSLALEPGAFMDPSDDSDEILNCYLQAGKYSARLAFELARELNRRHGTSYGLGYWREILVPWLCLVIQAAFGRFLLISRFVEKYGSEELVVEIAEGETDWQVLDIDEFARLLRTSEMDFWLNSLFMARLAPTNWKLIKVPLPQPAPRQAPTDMAGSQSLSGRIFRHFFKRLSFDNVAGVRVMSIFFSIYIQLLKARPDRTPPHDAEPPQPSPKIPGAVRQVVGAIIQSAMPQSYGTRFKELDDKAGRLSYKKGRLMVTSVTRYNDEVRFISAHAKEAGEKLVRTSHGINPGTAKFLLANDYEYDNHAYLSWGWTSHEQYGERFHPVPSPLLSKFAGKHRLRSSELIFVGTKMWSQPELFRPIPQPKGFLEYRKAKRIFLEGLEPGPLGNCSYRPYERSASDFEDLEFIRVSHPDLKICPGDLHQALLGCRLCVLDHLGTTLLIALAGNVPTVCFWNKDKWPISPEAETYFHTLEEAGIIRPTPRAAAGHINEIWHDVPGWWKTEKVQRARRQWCGQFARTSRVWWLHWLRTLGQL